MWPTSCELSSALDREARERGTSVYLPDRVIPMLPEVISNNLASLQPDKVRYTLSAHHGVHGRWGLRGGRGQTLGDQELPAIHV